MVDAGGARPIGDREIDLRLVEHPLGVATRTVALLAESGVVHYSKIGHPMSALGH